MAIVKSFQYKSILILVLAISVTLGVINPLFANAQTSQGQENENLESSKKEELLKRIEILRETVAKLQMRLKQKRESSSCMQLDRSLGMGMEGTDVRQLQDFLKSEGFFNYPTATGFYGPVTQQAVKKFQSSQKIVSSGSPSTTGFGLVGPRTRAVLKKSSCSNEEGEKKQEVVKENGEDDDKDDGGGGENEDKEPYGDGKDIEIVEIPTTNENTFAWLGAFRGFTDKQMETLAEKYDTLVIEKWHGEWNREKQHEDVRRLKQIDPDIEIYPYVPATLRFDKAKYGTNEFKDEWFLRSKKTNEILYFSPGHAYVDVANKEYREWMLDTVQGWLNSAPYDGVAFDNAYLAARKGSKKDFWEEEVGVEKMGPYNRGLFELFTKTREMIDSDQKIIYNGVGRKNWAANRNNELLDYADIALNELWCIGHIESDREGRLGEMLDESTDNPVHGIYKKSALIQDVNMMRHYTDEGKGFLMKLNHKLFDLNQEEKNELSRYCYAAFMLGHEPGLTKFKFGESYSADKGGINENAQEINIDFGEPLDRYRGSGDLIWREFENGWIYINMSTENDRTFKAPDDLVLVNGGVKGKTYSSGEEVKIISQDALFFLKRP